MNDKELTWGEVKDLSIWKEFVKEKCDCGCFRSWHYANGAQDNDNGSWFMPTLFKDCGTGACVQCRVGNSRDKYTYPCKSFSSFDSIIKELRKKGVDSSFRPL